MQTLIAFVSDHRPYLTHQEWADKLGIARSYFTEIINGSQLPSRRVIGLINDATAGAVPPGAWFKDHAEHTPDPAPVLEGQPALCERAE